MTRTPAVATDGQDTGVPPQAGSDLLGRIDAAKYTISAARLQLARLLDHAVLGGLDERAPLAADTFAAIRHLDEAFPSSTDMATGLPTAAHAIASLTKEK